MTQKLGVNGALTYDGEWFLFIVDVPICCYYEFYNDDQLYKTFRFDRVSNLQFIEGVQINNLTNL
jgi:hypothetical protein